MYMVAVVTAALFSAASVGHCFFSMTSYMFAQKYNQEYHFHRELLLHSTLPIGHSSDKKLAVLELDVNNNVHNYDHIRVKERHLSKKSSIAIFMAQTGHMICKIRDNEFPIWESATEYTYQVTRGTHGVMEFVHFMTFNSKGEVKSKYFHRTLSGWTMHNRENYILSWRQYMPRVGLNMRAKKNDFVFIHSEENTPHIIEYSPMTEIIITDVYYGDELLWSCYDDPATLISKGLLYTYDDMRVISLMVTDRNKKREEIEYIWDPSIERWTRKDERVTTKISCVFEVAKKNNDCCKNLDPSSFPNGYYQIHYPKPSYEIKTVYYSKGKNIENNKMFEYDTITYKRCVAVHRYTKKSTKIIELDLERYDGAIIKKCFHVMKNTITPIAVEEANEFVMKEIMALPDEKIDFLHIYEYGEL